MSVQPEIPAADEHAILESSRTLQAAYAAGEQASARALLADLITRYGIGAIAAVMAHRDQLHHLGTEVELLRLFGARTLYGDSGRRE